VSAEHIYQRANEAATSVDPMILANALDHIARTAAKSRSQTRRIRWIEQRALFALEGREYRDIDVELPKSAGPETAEKLKAKADHYKRLNADLLELIRVSIGNVRSLGPAGALAQVHTPYQEWLRQLEAVYTKATGEAA
jgi:hypothetical protein